MALHVFWGSLVLSLILSAEVAAAKGLNERMRSLTSETPCNEAGCSALNPDSCPKDRCICDDETGGATFICQDNPDYQHCYKVDCSTLSPNNCPDDRCVCDDETRGGTFICDDNPDYNPEE